MAINAVPTHQSDSVGDTTCLINIHVMEWDLTIQFNKDDRNSNLRKTNVSYDNHSGLNSLLFSKQKLVFYF